MVDWSISVGNILTLLGFIVGGIMFVVTMRRDVAVLSAQFKPLETAVSRLTTMMVESLEHVGRHDERIKSLERDMGRSEYNISRGRNGA